MERACTDCRLARVDLDRMAVTREDISAIARRFLGGRGVNNYLLLKEIPRGIRPFDGENAVIFGGGLLAGSHFPGANRVNVGSLSPVTGGLGSGGAGGGFAIESRASGIDHLLISGKASKPVYIWVHDDEIEIVDAGFLWGLSTRDTVRALRDRIGDATVQIACIGPAGEKMSLNSCLIFTEERAVGRCGLGAVLGSKKVKAIAVKGNGGVTPLGADFKELIDRAAETCRKSPVLQGLRRVGTVSYGTVEGDPHRLTPFKNYQYTEPAKRFRLVDFEQFHVGTAHVPDCPFSCAQRYRVPTGKYRGCYTEKLEGNSRGNFGERLALENPAAIIRAHELCQLYGLDVDNTSGAIAWAFECYQRKIMNTRDTGGLKLEWGNEPVILQLIEEMGKREGFGELIADGCHAAAKKLGRGSEAFCLEVKGQALQETLRAYKGWALGVVVSERGGGHTRGAPCTEFGAIGSDADEKRWSPQVSQALFGFPNAGDATSYENKANLVVYYERFHAILDSIGLCYFMSNWIDPHLLSLADIAGIVSSAVGERVAAESLMETGERIVCLGKLFNQVHTGWGRQQDYPPLRLMQEPVESGPYKGERLDREAWNVLLDDYYRLHDWNATSGRITGDCLTAHELEDLSPQVEQ